MAKINKPKLGRPKAGSTPITVATPPILLKDLDAWRSKQRDNPSRPQAMRYLARVGLKHEMGQ